MVVGVLGELTPQQEVAKLESGGEGELVNAPSFSFEGNKERELSIDLPVEQPLDQLDKETMLV